MPEFNVEIQGRRYRAQAPNIEIMDRAVQRFADWLQNGQTAQAPQMEPQAGNTGIATPSRAQAAANAQQGQGFGVPNPAPPSTAEYEMDQFDRMLSEAIREGRPTTEKVTDWVRDVGNGLTFGNFNELTAAADQIIPGGMGFRDRLAYEDQQDALHRGENPGATTAIDIGGGLATGAAMMRGGLSPLARAQPTMGSVVPAAALESAGYGAVAGFGHGTPGTFDIAERGRNAAAGAGVGAALGGALGAAGGTMANQSVVRRAPTNEALAAGTDAAYGAMRNQNIRLSGNSFDNVINQIDADLAGQNIAAMAPGSASQRYLNWLHTQSGQAPTMDAVDLMRRGIRDEARQIRNSATPDLNDARLLERMAGTLDTYMMDPLVPTVGGASPTAAQASLMQGRQLSLQQRKSETIQEALADASVAPGMRRLSPLAYQQAVTAQFSNLIKDPARMGMFSTEEQALLRQVANGNLTERVLGYLGRLAPGSLLTGNLLSPTTLIPVAGYAGAGARGAAGVIGAGEIAGRMSSGMTRQNAALADALSRSGGTAQANAAIIPILQALLSQGSSRAIIADPTQALLDIMMPPRRQAAQ